MSAIVDDKQSCLIETEVGDIGHQLEQLMETMKNDEQQTTNANIGAEVFRLLNKLESFELHLTVLKSTKIGIVLNKLRKCLANNANEEEARLMTIQLIRKWKTIATDEFLCEKSLNKSSRKRTTSSSVAIEPDNDHRNSSSPHMSAARRNRTVSSDEDGRESGNVLFL